MKTSYQAALDRLAESNIATTTASLGAGGSYRAANIPLEPNFRIPNSLSANASVEPDRQILTDLARDAVRNYPIATGINNTYLTNVVGAHLVYQAAVDVNVLKISEEQGQEIESQIEAEWNLFANSKNCDYTRTHNFVQLCAIIVQSALSSGDVFINSVFKRRPNHPYTLTAQILEADRISNPYYHPDTPTLCGGLEYDNTGDLHYIHVRSQHPGDTTIAEYKWDKFPVFGEKTGFQRIFQVKSPFGLRPDQSRGVSIFASALPVLRQTSDFAVAELTRAQLQSTLGGGVVKLASDLGDAPLFGQVLKASDRQNPLASAQMRINTYKNNSGFSLRSGEIISLLPGDDFQMPPLSSPNAHFPEFVGSLGEQISTATGLPYEVVMRAFKSSYSAARAAEIEAGKSYQQIRQWLLWDFCKPFFDLWIEEAVLSGRLKLKGFLNDPLKRQAYLQGDFLGARQIPIDEMKAANAAAKRIEIGISSRAMECASLGISFDTIMAQRKREEKLFPAPAVPKDNNNPVDVDDVAAAMIEAVMQLR